MIILDLGLVSATSVCDFYNKLFYKVKTESFIITNCFRSLQVLTVHLRKQVAVLQLKGLLVCILGLIPIEKTPLYLWRD